MLKCPKCGESLPTFGFTREDVESLRGLAFFAADHHYRKGGEKAANIADRIEALLPPEG